MLKQLEEIIGSQFHGMGGQVFLNKAPLAQQLRPTINEWDFIKLKSSCIVKKKTQSDKK